MVHPLYQNSKFPKYAHTEYPKRLRFEKEDGSTKTVRVTDRAQELQAIATNGKLKAQTSDPREEQFNKVVKQSYERERNLTNDLQQRDSELARLQEEMARLKSQVHHQSSQGQTTKPTDDDVKVSEGLGKPAPDASNKDNQGRPTSAGNSEQKQPEVESNKRVSGEIDSKADDEAKKQAAPTSGTTTSAFPKSGNKI